MQTIRVSLPGYNALTEANIYRYSLYADSDNLLIKEFARGAGTVADGADATITHSLGYIPFYIVYSEIDDLQYRIVNNFDPVGSGWRSYATTTTLVIENRYSNVFNHYRYYIFYDNLT